MYSLLFVKTEWSTGFFLHVKILSSKNRSNRMTFRTGNPDSLSGDMFILAFLFQNKTYSPHICIIGFCIIRITYKGRLWMLFFGDLSTISFDVYFLVLLYTLLWGGEGVKVFKRCLIKYWFNRFWNAPEQNLQNVDLKLTKFCELKKYMFEMYSPPTPHAMHGYRYLLHSLLMLVENRR